MLQKVIRVGNSLGVTLPKEYVRSRKIKAGQKVNVNAIPGEEALIIRKASYAKIPAKKSAARREFNKWLKAVLKEDAEILDELAVR
ncbi:MAG: AbrB/MazE/SpoVT family DNA-binding domain-containing protein [Patescibacteria group bacterium]